MSGEKQWCLYIVECADGTLYTGITNDLPKRLDAHNRGTASRYTRVRRPVHLRYQEPQTDRSSASKREAAVKRLSRVAKDLLIAQARVGLRQKKPRSVRSRRNSSSREKSKSKTDTAPSMG